MLSVTASVQDETDFPFSRYRTKMIASRAPRVTAIAAISKAHDNKEFRNAGFVRVGFLDCSEEEVSECTDTALISFDPGFAILENGDRISGASIWWGA